MSWQAELRDTLVSLWHGGISGGRTVAINMKPRSSPWGGGNQFVQLLSAHLRERGWRVVHRLGADVTCILMIDPRPLATSRFDAGDIAAFKRKYPHVRCVHRINECDQRKGTSGVDEMLRQGNQVADFTVFVSEWLRDYFRARWFDAARPHAAINNAADERVFSPALAPRSDSEFRLVTHHWSDNWMKGFHVYQELDRMIADGELPGCAFTVIGRWPRQIRWRSAHTHPPAHGAGLAALLRQNDAYITASLWDPGPMHVVEAVQCGLPLLYHEDGGGIVEIGRRYGIGFRDDLHAAVLAMRRQHGALRRQVLASPPSGTQMCERYERIFTRLAQGMAA